MSRKQTTTQRQLSLQKSLPTRNWSQSSDCSPSWTKQRSPVEHTGHRILWRRSSFKSCSRGSRLTSRPTPNWGFLFNAPNCNSTGMSSTDPSRTRAMRASRSSSMQTVFASLHFSKALPLKTSPFFLIRCGAASTPRKMMTTLSLVYGPRTSPPSPWSPLRKSPKLRSVGMFLPYRLQKR